MPEHTEVIFTKSFIEQLPPSYLDAVCVITEHYQRSQQNLPTAEMTRHEHYLRRLEAYAFLTEFLTTSAELTYKLPSIDGNASRDTSTINTAFQTVNQIAKGAVAKRDALSAFQSAREAYAGNVRRPMYYEFSDSDLDRVQQLINELRELLTKTDEFPTQHRARLLHKLERLQAEVHKTMSNFDRFWGFVVEAGPVIGQFAKDVKPLFDRVRELGEIFVRAQARCTELPASTLKNLLPQSRRGSGNDERDIAG